LRTGPSSIIRDSRSRRLSCVVLRSGSRSCHSRVRTRLQLRYEGSADNVTYPELAEALGHLAPIELQYVGNNATGGPHSIQSVVTGNIDFGSSFNGVQQRISDWPAARDESLTVSVNANVAATTLGEAPALHGA